MDEKQSIREEIRKKRNSISKEEVKLKGAAVAEKLMATEEYKKAKAVLFYAAKGNEVQTKELIEKALNECRTALLPIANSMAKEIEVSEIKDYSKDLKKGAFGIMEPKLKKPVNEESIDAVIVPGVAFDLQGHRLGYGLGFYDKLLRRLANKKKKKIWKIGLAYDFQVVEKLPTEGHDQRMDIIVTERRAIRCK